MHFTVDRHFHPISLGGLVRPACWSPQVGEKQHHHVACEQPRLRDSIAVGLGCGASVRDALQSLTLCTRPEAKITPRRVCDLLLDMIPAPDADAAIRKRLMHAPVTGAY